jgi:hypothetical protein
MSNVETIFNYVGTLTFLQILILVVIVPVVLTLCIALFVRVTRLEKFAGAEFDTDGNPVPKKTRRVKKSV